MDDLVSKVEKVIGKLADGSLPVKVCEWYESNSKGTRVIIENPFVEIAGHLNELGGFAPFWLKMGNSWYTAWKIDPKSTEKRLGLIVKGPISR